MDKSLSIKEMDIRNKRNLDENEAFEDLERYRNIPLHAIFLYTSEDKEINDYLISNWGALDSLSGNYCDIHPIIDQFSFVEDAYDFIERLNIIKKSEFKEISQLPGIFFWDIKGKHVYVSFGETITDKNITNTIRIIFEGIRINPTIEEILKLNKMLNKKRSSQKSLWNDAWPFLLIFITVLASVVFAAKFITPIVLGIILIFSSISFILIGIFLFKYRDVISEKSFVDILTLLIRQIPLLNKDSKKNKA